MNNPYQGQDNSVALKENIILGKKYRFTILTDRLIRIEYNKNGTFLDKPTTRVKFRKFPKVNYKVSKTETLIQIVTSYFTVDYVMEKSFTGSKLASSSTLKVTLNNTDRAWYYNHPEARNFGTITYSLDDYTKKLHLDKGLYSTDGFAYLDDSNSMITGSNNTFIKRDSDDIDLYVFVYRKDLGLALRDYYELTGYPILLPRYAFGVWWYKDTKYTSQDIAKVITKFQEEEIPLSVFLLGNKWHDEKEIVLFHKNLDPNLLKTFLAKTSVHLGITINPNENISKNSNTYQTLSNYLSGNTSFLPLTQNKLNAYTNYYINNLINNGINAFYIDYNQIKDKETLNILNTYHKNIYTQVTNKRSLILTRNHNLAIHTKGVIFTGKTRVGWNTLSILPRYNASASNLGISYIASSVGGFYGGIEDFELYIRYIQLGVFSPLMILASDDSKYYRREPWRFSVSESEILKKYLNLKNKLIPYIYTESYIYHKLGSPIIQPLYYKYPKIYDEPMYANEYFFGSQMLICPITKKKNSIMNRAVQRLFIPEGVWYELESGKKYLGNKYYMSFYKDDDYPAFVREGSIMIMSNDLNTDNPSNIEVQIFPGANGSYKLYEDDGISLNYLKDNNCMITEYTYTYTKDKYQLSIKPTGKFNLVPDFRNYKIKFRNTNTASITVSDGVNNVGASAKINKEDLIIDVPNVTSQTPLLITISGNNLSNSTLKQVNDDILGILEDLEIETLLKEEIDKILFSELSIRKKRIAIRKLKRKGLEPKFIKIFLKLLEYIQTV